MKLFFLSLILFCFTFTFSQNAVVSKTLGPLQFVELDHGLAQVVDGKVEQVKNTPTGTHGWLEDLVITEVTDSIRVVKKANFGVVYMVKAKDTADIDVVIEWIYPQKVTNGKGESFKSIKYSTKRPTNIPSASSYSLDEPYEMVKGEWKLNMYLEKKKCTAIRFFFINPPFDVFVFPLLSLTFRQHFFVTPLCRIELPEVQEECFLFVYRKIRKQQIEHCHQRSVAALASISKS